ncbi:hypothetical protein BKA62DRAFT_686320 [Auriculariales sp. MPI-PUGE-AT-0066]|nr:hypothetical protein BKA62DRAFT_686320 [Auriculariales sp. MPI-PUGE-AT-0066]
MTAPSCRWATLAPELLFLVFGSDTSVASRRVHRQTLLSCALVCRSWSGVAQSVLFQHIELESCAGYQHRLTRLISTLSYAVQSRDKRHLALAVRSLSVDIGAHWSPTATLCTHADASSVALAVHCCPQLRHLRLTVREGVRHAFTDTNLALLRKSRSVTKLSIRADSSPMLPQLLHIWPQLTFLDSRTSSGFPCSISAFGDLPASCAIRELHASSTAPDVIARLAAPFACSLRALTLVSHQRTGAPPTRPLLDGSVVLPALTSATLDCEFDADTLESLPCTVEHVGLVFWDHALFRVLRSFIARRIDTIKAISLLEPPKSCMSARGADEHGLLDFCARSGIAVRYRSREELVTAGGVW